MPKQVRVGQPTFAAELRSVARHRILRAAQESLAELGTSFTVEQVAERAGVSRRTVFRYFPTHDELVGAALAETLVAYGDRFPKACPPGVDFDVWLVESATAIHTANKELFGRAFWDVHIRVGGPAERKAVADLGARRAEWHNRIVTDAWQAAGGRKTPPDWLIEAFFLQLSAFATFAMEVGRAQDAEMSGRVSAMVLSKLVSAAL